MQQLWWYNIYDYYSLYSSAIPFSRNNVDIPWLIAYSSVDKVLARDEQWWTQSTKINHELNNPFIANYNWLWLINSFQLKWITAETNT